MNENAFVINTIFKGINFVIFIAVCWYYFYKKVLANLVQKMHERHALIPNLEQERRGLHNQEANIETAIEQQALVAKVLQKKIEGWATTHQKNLREHEEKNMHMKHLLAQKMHTQEEYRAKKVRYANVIPIIVAQTQEALAQKYQKPDHAQKYMDTLFLRIKDEL